MFFAKIFSVGISTFFFLRSEVAEFFQQEMNNGNITLIFDES